MGNFVENKSVRQTEKGNQYYEFKRVSTEELKDYRISAYGYLA